MRAVLFAVVDHQYDAVVVGAGGAGLRAAFGLVQGQILLKPAFVTIDGPALSRLMLYVKG
jgi:succinate dehydrogenase/fumarate reductase flavoprotein subunit